MIEMYKKIKEISPLYDNLIFDMWGVLGINNSDNSDFVIYNQDLIDNINDLNCNKFILSNVVWPKEYIYDLFQRHNLQIKQENIFTVQSILDDHLYDTKCHLFYINQIDPLQRYKIEKHHNSSIEEADTIIIPSFNSYNVKDMQEAYNKLKPYAHKQFICLNADHYSPSSHANIPSSGLLSKWLIDEFNANVKILGKPNKNMFDAVLKHAKGRSLMIGDTVKNDILGAHNANIDSALVPTGNNHGKTISEMNTLCQSYKCTPPKHLIKLF